MSSLRWVDDDARRPCAGAVTRGRLAKVGPPAIRCNVDPRRRALALGILVALVCAGLAMHAREIVLGRSTRRRTPPGPRFDTGERLVGLR
jgi:hypothetical protein